MALAVLELGKLTCPQRRQDTVELVAHGLELERGWRRKLLQIPLVHHLVLLEALGSGRRRVGLSLERPVLLRMLVELRHHIARGAFCAAKERHGEVDKVAKLEEAEEGGANKVEHA